jgi:hypothetical protein
MVSKWPKKYIMVRNGPSMDKMTQNDPLAQMRSRPQVDLKWFEMA